MGVNTQSVGRILSVQKIVVGGIERTPEGAVTDGKVTQYMLIRGSTGNDAIVDTNGNLVCMLKGDQNLPIAQDATGNLVAVMKGNYAGALKTWKVDADGRGEMFISDPVDVWGHVTTIGLAELAVRNHAVPMPFDRRGNVIYWDNYESGTPKYDLYSLFGGTLLRSTDYAHNGSFSLKCTPTGGAGSRAGPKYRITDFHEDGTVLAKFSMTSADAAGWYFCVSIMYYDGTNMHSAFVRYAAGGGFQYYDSAGVWQALPTIGRYENPYNWGSISIGIDLSTKKYLDARIFRTDHDLSAYSIHSSASALDPHLEIRSYFEDIAGTSIVGYVDDFVVMENVS